MEPSFCEFSNNNQPYQRWLRENPNGFVINTLRTRSTSYMLLHRASCYSIRKYNQMARPGGFTERQYIKICSNSIDSLRAWAKANGRRDGSFSGVCKRCNPPAAEMP